jgi:Holliday junction DNA helicase RuvA
MTAELLPGAAVIDCGGIGFRVNTSQYTLSQLRSGEKAKLYTYVYIREGVFEIYGFASLSEEHCFEMLLGVSGVGPKAAAAILSVNTPEGLVMAIISENDKAISAAPGVGKKIAQRVILELKDKMAKETESVSYGDLAPQPALPGTADTRSDAAAALAVLGYSSAEINAALRSIDTAALSLEDTIRAALKQMVK